MTDTRTLERGLFDAPDGGVAWEFLQALKRRARTDQEARRALGRYVLEGPIPHVRGFAAAALASGRIPKDREDAKAVLTASHGEGTRVFRRVAPSFLAWLEALGRAQDTRRARRG